MSIINDNFMIKSETGKKLYAMVKNTQLLSRVDQEQARV